MTALNGPECKHESVMPTVTDEELRGLSAREVRTSYPRFFGTCPDCGQELILYASYMHYLAGDY